MISNSGHDERGQYSGGAAGDQTGGEWTRIKWYNRPWNVVLRHPDPAVGGLIAQLAGEAADNNKIGYDQGERGMFWIRLKQAGYFPSAIRILCESDCSAGVAAIVKAAGYILGDSRLQGVSPDAYTGNLKAALQTAGFTALTDSKYLTSDQYLLPGDILLYEGHHTAVNLDFGSNIMPIYTVEKHIAATAAFAKVAKAGKYIHGDSHSIPPCADHVTSCDRGAVARPLYDLGYTDQPRGGVTVINMGDWLVAHGWKKLSPNNGLRRGDIVLMKQNGESTPSAAWHTFLVTDVFTSGRVTLINKYDFGSTERIWAGAYFAGTPVNQWPNRSVYCIFRFEDGHKEYVFSPSELVIGTENNSAYLATEILKARGYKGIYKNGKRQDLELNFKWTIGDMAAAADNQASRFARGVKVNTMAGCVSMAYWADLLGALPFACAELPTTETKGLSVLLVQEILKARGFKGADGKELTLDREWGANTAHAVRAYQKARGFKETGTVDFDLWKDMINI